jgi:transketolase
MSAAAGSGHPTSSMSAAELIAVLADGYLRYNVDDPHNPANDRLVFSKGHASVLLYALYRALGLLSEDDLASYRRHGSPLEGHPTPVLPWVDVATGSLGQGLPIGVGMALAVKALNQSPARVWVLCGDSELAEGSMWEAFEHAAFYGLDNLTAIVDVNRLGQRGETMVGWNLDVYAERARAFGWHAIEIDGHDVEAIDRAYAEAVATTGSPTVVFARTVKGRGVKSVEDRNGFHGKPLEDPEGAIAELGGPRSIRIEPARPEPYSPPKIPARPLELPRYEIGALVATRQAYGDALAALGSARGDVVVLDGEVSNSTYAEVFAKAHPERFFEMFIAEQQLVAAGVGMQVLGWRPFCSSFAAFLSRAYDFVRMAAVSRARLALCGSHAGVSIGEDGPSQMGLEDLALFRAVQGSVVLHPCDANQTAKLVAAMVGHEGISYLRTLRPATRVLYGPDEDFAIGGSRVLRSSDADEVTIVASGITVHEALAAADALAEEGIAARVLDLYSIKPLDLETLAAAAAVTEGRIVTVEDHWPEGGLGDAVASALAATDAPARVVKLAVPAMPASGKPAELLAWAGIDAAGITSAVRSLVGAPAGAR